jgi:hypothetical protein
MKKQNIKKLEAEKLFQLSGSFLERLAQESKIIKTAPAVYDLESLISYVVSTRKNANAKVDDYKLIKTKLAKLDYKIQRGDYLLKTDVLNDASTAFTILKQEFNDLKSQLSGNTLETFNKCFERFLANLAKAANSQAQEIKTINE